MDTDLGRHALICFCGEGAAEAGVAACPLNVERRPATLSL